MDITEITNEEIISLIGGDRALLNGRTGEDKQAALLDMQEEDEDLVAQFRRRQVQPRSCVAQTLLFNP